MLTKVDIQSIKNELHKFGLYNQHEHLGGCVKPHILWEIAKMRGINPMGVNDYELFKSRYVVNSMDHDDYVDNKFALTHAIQSSPDAVQMSIFHAASEAYRNSGVKAIEIRFNPMMRNQNKLYDIDMIIMGALTGARLASTAYSIKVGIIIESDRRFSDNMALILAEKAVQYSKAGICGFDISGGSDYPLLGFRDSQLGEIYKYLKTNGIKTTVHLSETGDKREVEEAVLPNMENVLDRIGHGIYIYQDNRLISRIKDAGIALEICPTSNVKLGVVRDWDHMGLILRTLYNSNVKFSINTDATEFMGINVVDEYINLIARGIFNQDEIMTILENSKNSMFVD